MQIHMWHVWPHFGIQITKLYKSTPHDCFNLTRTWAQAEGVAQVREGAGGKYSVQAMVAWQLLLPGIFPGELSQVCQYWGIGAAPAAWWLRCGWQRLETHPTRNQRQSVLDTCTNYGDRLQAALIKQGYEIALACLVARRTLSSCSRDKALWGCPSAKCLRLEAWQLRGN